MFQFSEGSIGGNAVDSWEAGTIKQEDDGKWCVKIRFSVETGLTDSFHSIIGPHHWIS